MAEPLPPRPGTGHPAGTGEARVISLAAARGGVRLGDAVEAFFAEAALAANTERTYRGALGALAAHLGEAAALGDVDAAAVRRVALGAWGARAPATWNTRRTALRAFAAWARDAGHTSVDFAAGLAPRRVPRDDSRAIAAEVLEELFGRASVPLREKALWRMLYETAARANEVLALNVEDLDMAAKRAPVIAKGGHRELIIWASGTARLLPRYLAGRRAGPLFVTATAPGRALAAVDVCPTTGRGRLSYGQAWALFRRHSVGATLHQLRHSALTHLAEQGASEVMLQAKSRHRDVRTLARYARPGPDAVAELTERLGPPPRHRRP